MALLTKEICTPLVLLVVVCVALRCVLYNKINVIQDKQQDHIATLDLYCTEHEDNRSNC